jgi:hypothetical protein
VAEAKPLVLRPRDEGLLGGRDAEVVPPLAIGGRKGVALRGEDGVAVEEGVKAVLGGRTLRDKAAAVSDEGAEFADGVRGNPDLGDKVDGEELGQGEGIDLVGFDLGSGPVPVGSGQVR